MMHNTTTYLREGEGTVEETYADMCVECDGDWKVVLDAKFNALGRRHFRFYGELRLTVLLMAKQGDFFTLEQGARLSRWWAEESKRLVHKGLAAE